VREKLMALVRLAEIDASARDLEDQIRGIPVELEERRAAMEALEELVGGQKLQLDEAIALQDQQAEEIRHRTELLARAKSKGAKARTMREAEAAEREVEAMRRAIRDGEAELERLGETIEKTRGILAQPLEELSKQRQELEAAQASMDSVLAELREKSARVTQGREALLADVPKKVARKYERLRVKVHPMVVEVQDNGVCTGCQMALPPQLFIQVQKVDELHQCPQCHRYVFHPGSLEARDEPSA
jgi:predicted  nucleic acid-binding Zn-ribbon protein